MGMETIDIRVPGAVWYDALDPLATEMQDALGLPDPRSTRRGRGTSFFYDAVSLDVAADLADYLQDRANTLWGSTEPSERSALRGCIETFERIRQAIKETK